MTLQAGANPGFGEPMARRYRLLWLVSLDGQPATAGRARGANLGYGGAISWHRSSSEGDSIKMKGGCDTAPGPRPERQCHETVREKERAEDASLPHQLIITE